MAEAVTEPNSVFDAPPRSTASGRGRVAWRAPLLALALGVSAPAAAQLPPAPQPISDVEDARTLPKGTVVLRAMNAWTRIDNVFDALADSIHHLHPLGNAFSAGAVGTAQYPGLAPVEAALRTLTGDPNISINLGQQFATVDTRIVTTPFTLEYGLTDRLTLGVMVPVVQTQSDVFIELNPKRTLPNSGINMGPNPAALGNTTAINGNGALVRDLDAANSALAS